MAQEWNIPFFQKIWQNVIKKKCLKFKVMPKYQNMPFQVFYIFFKYLEGGSLKSNNSRDPSFVFFYGDPRLC